MVREPEHVQYVAATAQQMTLVDGHYLINELPCIDSVSYMLGLQIEDLNEIHSPYVKEAFLFIAAISVVL